MKQWITPFLLVAALLGFTSCRSSSDIIATGLKLELVRVEHAGDGTVQVTWRVNNPNVVPYLVDRVQAKVSLDGAVVGSVNDDNRLGVPKQERVDRTSTLKLANAAAGERIAQLAAKGSASYEFDATIWLLIVDDDRVKADLKAAGTVPVVAK